MFSFRIEGWRDAGGLVFGLWDGTITVLQGV